MSGGRPAPEAVAQAVRRLPAVGWRDARVAATVQGGPMRLFDGRLWRPVHVHLPDRDGGPTFLGCHAIDPDRAWSAVVNALWPGGRLRDYGPRTYFGTNPWLDPGRPPWDEDARDDGLLPRLQGSAVLVDGVLHAACEPPALFVRMDMGPQERPSLVCPSDVSLTGGVSLFSAGRRRDASALAGREVPEPPPLGQGWSVGPGCPGRDDAACLPEEILHDFLAACHCYGVGLVSPRVTGWLADLRELQGAGRPGLGDVRDRLLALREATDGFPPQGNGSSLPGDVAGMRARGGRRIHDVSSFHLRRIEFETLGHPEDEDALAALATG